ncbi:hypothetical protein [Pseudophaeobacter flagellatus]|uniref:hypothetical protein n=1 Tax=Pseudophaeobacter flagellatus TaxID=2899119 RepID=UPI001E44F4CB|nr:hypothetical protein [Pseudophaeobacter flagellatus]MCD9150164.1 hypothetical protein [Pseudophaeobacter flagellatus]
MNEANRIEAAFLRKLPSDEAANYLLEKYADSYPVTIKHRSWKVADQFRLARRFLQGRAFASARPYQDFLSFMSLENFLKVVADGLSDIPEDRLDLLFYYLVPALRKAAKNDLQLKKVEEFIDRWSAGR